MWQATVLLKGGFSEVIASELACWEVLSYTASDTSPRALHTHTLGYSKQGYFLYLTRLQKLE